MEGRERRNWLELPPELTSSILQRLGAIQILVTAQKVCRSWRDLCREPSMWQIIDMKNFSEETMEYYLEMMCRHAIDRSQGSLVDISIEYVGDNSLLQYIADSSSNLRRLKLDTYYPITYEVLAKALMKFPLLEELEIPDCSVRGESLKLIGQSCPNLKTLKLKRGGYVRFGTERDEDALAIAENMPRLRHLQLFGNRLSDTGLKAILDKCLLLEHLDLRHCLNIKLVGNLEKRCSERIKVVKFPNDPTDDKDSS